jgi:olfactory receptor
MFCYHFWIYKWHSSYCDDLGLVSGHLSPIAFLGFMDIYLCGFVVLVICIILLNFLYAHVQSLIALLFTCIKKVRFLISFVITSQILNYACFDILNNIVKYFSSAIFFPSSVILFSYSKIVSIILRIPSSSGKIRSVLLL